MLEWYAQPRYRPFSLIHADAREERPGVLMIHGFTGTPDELRGAAEIAHAAGFDVEVTCLPGMGADIARFRTVNREDWLRAARHAWRELASRYRRRLLVGYSLGAALAIHAATDVPPDAMLLLAPLIRIADSRAFALPVIQRVMREVVPFNSLDFSQPQVQAFFRKALPGLDLTQPEVQQALRSEYVMPTRLLNDCRLVGRDAGRLASAISMPVTIVQGRPDHIVGHRNARWLVDQLAGPVVYHEIPGDHLIPFREAESWPAVERLLIPYFADRYADRYAELAP